MNNTAVESGAGIYVEQQAAPTFSDMYVAGNTAAVGAGAFLTGSSTPKFTNVTFEGNTAVQTGGAVESHLECDPVFTNCSFVSNTAGREGGAIYATGLLTGSEFLSTITMSGCDFVANGAATSDGGAVYAASSVEVVASRLLFARNLGRVGGALMIAENSVVFACQHCSFVSNVASSAGGAVYIAAAFPPFCSAWTNITSFNNSAGFFGGGAYLGNPTGTSEACADRWQQEFFAPSAMNTAPYFGPAVASASVAVRLVNTTRRYAIPNAPLTVQVEVVDVFSQRVVLPADPGSVHGMELLVYVVVVENTMGGRVVGTASWTVSHLGLATVSGVTITHGYYAEQLNVSLGAVPPLTPAALRLEIQHCPAGYVCVVLVSNVVRRRLTALLTPGVHL